MTLLHPGWLALLLLVPITALWPRRIRDLRHFALRTMVITALTLALAHPVRITRVGTEHHVVVVDLSASTDADGARAAAARVLDVLPEGARTTLVRLGGDQELRLGTDREIALAAGGTDLDAAVGVAADAILESAAGAVTLVTDGLATRAVESPTLEALIDRDIPLHVVSLAAARDDVRLVGFDVPADARVGHTTRVHVRIAGPRTTVDVTVSDEDGELARVDGVTLDGIAVVALEIEPRRAGFVALTATCRVAAGHDARPDTESLVRLVGVQDPIRVLRLGRRVTDGAASLARLLGAGFRIDDPETVAGNGFARHDVVMLDDVPAEEIPTETQVELLDSVRDLGTGLVMCGGRASFGAGGYHDTPIEDALPVELVQKEEKKDPSTALAVIIDTSGSMGGNRIRLAKEVTRLAIRRLLPHDKVGIVEFYGAKRWAAPLQSAANAIDIQRAINRLDSGGGTVLFPAIEEAYYGLKNVQTRYKHVLVLTDAGVESGPYESLLRRMARDGICVSSVLVGPERHSEFLVQMADWGNGRFYNASNRFNLPEVMLKQPSTSRLPSYRPGTWKVTRRGGPRWWGRTPPREIPPLAGFVETRARTGAEVVLETARGAHPILASWHHGVGRVTALTTEPVGPGTRSWSDWSAYGSFLGRVLTRSAGGSPLPHRFELTRTPDGARLLAYETRPDPAPDAHAPSARVLGEDGESTPLDFRPRAPGVFEATLSLGAEEELRVEAGVAGRPELGVWRGALDPTSRLAPELQVDPAVTERLARAATRTGGGTTSPDAPDLALRAGGGAGALTTRDLRPFLAAAALLFLLLDILHRRLPRSRESTA